MAVPLWFFLLCMFVMTVTCVLGNIVSYRRGLHAPLTQRQVALRADVRRAENNLGIATPRQRSARFNRRRTR